MGLAFGIVIGFIFGWAWCERRHRDATDALRTEVEAADEELQ